MKRDPLKATVLATRYIPNATQKMVQDLITAGGIIEYDPQRHRSLALLTADCDDVTYTALDEATKKADVDVIYAHSFYAGAANANTKLAGEIIGVLAGPNPAEARAGLEAAVDLLKMKLISYLQMMTIPFRIMHIAFPVLVLICPAPMESKKVKLLHT